MERTLEHPHEPRTYSRPVCHVTDVAQHRRGLRKRGTTLYFLQKQEKIRKDKMRWDKIKWDKARWCKMRLDEIKKGKLSNNKIKWDEIR